MPERHGEPGRGKPSFNFKTARPAAPVEPIVLLSFRGATLGVRKSAQSLSLDSFRAIPIWEVCLPLTISSFAVVVDLGGSQMRTNRPHADDSVLPRRCARFGRIIEGFDLFENQFHHALVDEPLDDDP